MKHERLYNITRIVSAARPTAQLERKLISQVKDIKTDVQLRQDLAPLVITVAYCVYGEKYLQQSRVSYVLEQWCPQYEAFVDWYLQFFGTIGNEYHSCVQLGHRDAEHIAHFLDPTKSISDETHRFVLAFWHGVKPLANLKVHNEEGAIEKMMNVVTFVQAAKEILERTNTTKALKEFKSQLLSSNVAISSKLERYIADNGV